MFKKESSKKLPHYCEDPVKSKGSANMAEAISFETTDNPELAEVSLTRFVG